MRRQLVLGRTRCFRVGRDLSADTQHRQQRHHEDDDAHTAEPVREGTPKKQGVWHGLDVGQNGSACGTEAGAGLEKCIRAALESVPAGQMEAGYCVGMTYLQTMRRIVLPQALRTAFPPLFNSLISLLKDTSLAANITVTEMFMATQRIVARTYESLPLYLEVAFIYLMFSTILTQVQRWGEKKLNAKGFSQNS